MIPYINTQEVPIENVGEGKKKKMDDFQYMYKLRSAVCVFILFLLLSNKVAYKVLDIIAKVFSNNINIIDDQENPQFMGTFIMAVIIAFVIFVF